MVLTSSAAAAIVSPMTVMYAATKSFLSSFGASLAVEVKHAGVDVLVFHPSPVNTRYDSAPAFRPVWCALSMSGTALLKRCCCHACRRDSAGLTQGLPVLGSVSQRVRYDYFV